MALWRFKAGLTTVYQPLVTTLSMTLHGSDKQDGLFVSKILLNRLCYRAKIEVMLHDYKKSWTFSCLVLVRYELQTGKEIKRVKTVKGFWY